MLAYSPPAERDELIRTLELAPLTPKTITSRIELAKECERIVQRGYSTDLGESEEGIHCVAAGIFDRSHSLVAALWISAPSAPARQRSGLLKPVCTCGRPRSKFHCD